MFSYISKMLTPDTNPASVTNTEGDNPSTVVDITTPIAPTMYNQEDVDRMLKEKEREVREKKQVEENKVRQAMREITAKLDESTIHDRRQLEEIKKLKDTLGKEKESNRQLERVNEGYENARLDNLDETHSLERKGAKEMYRLMMEETNKLYEFAQFIKQTVDPDCPELDAFIDQQQKFLTKVREDPYLRVQGEELKLFHIHRVDWNPENLFMEIFQALKDRENGTFSTPPPQIPQMPPDESTDDTTVSENDPLIRLVKTVKEVYPDLSDEEVLNALDEIREEKGGLGTYNQVLEWIASNVMQPKCMVCSRVMDREEEQETDIFKIPCCGQQFHVKCIHEYLQTQGHCPKCKN